MSQTQHDDVILRHSLRKVNGDTRGGDQARASIRSRVVFAPTIGGQDDMGCLGADFCAQAHYDFAVAQPSSRAGKQAQKHAGIIIRDEQEQDQICASPVSSPEIDWPL